MKILEHIFYLSAATWSSIIALDRPPGMGGVYIDDRIRIGEERPVLPGKIVEGSITVVKIGRCYSMSTIDSTSHGDQILRSGEARFLPYIVQNQGNIRDSISFEGKLDIQAAGKDGGICFAGPDSQAVGTVGKSGMTLQYGVWLEPGEIETLFVKLEVPFATVYAAMDSFDFKIDIKNQCGTGGGSDSTDDWPGGRTVFRVGALYTDKGILTDRTAMTKSQDWMVDQFRIKVSGAVNPLTAVYASPENIQENIFASETKAFLISLDYPQHFKEPLRFGIKGTTAKIKCVLFKSNEPAGILSAGELLLPASLGVRVSAVAETENITAEQCTLTCSHDRFGQRNLVTMSFTVEPREMAAVARDRVQVLGLKPNPFADLTAVSYYLPKDLRVWVGIYDAGSVLIKELVNARQGYGIHRAVWDGKNEAGDRIKSGIYFCRIEAGALIETRKIMYINP